MRCRARAPTAAPTAAATAATVSPSSSSSSAAHAAPQRPLASYLLQPVRAIGLCWFRRAFALAIVYDSVRLAQRGELEDYFAPAGRMHFTYGWPLPTPPRLATEHIVRFPWIICLSAAGFGAGILPRLCLATFIVAYWWLFLSDAVRYVNHYYLYALHGILLLVAARRGSDGAACRRVDLLALRAQWTIVYFYAGLAKCNAEFVLRGEPLRTYFAMAVAEGRPLRPLLHGLLDTELSVAFGVAFAIVFDLLAGFALWRPRWVWPVTAVAATFHLANSLVIFNTIGSFPYVSLAASLLFMREEEEEEGKEKEKVKVGDDGERVPDRRRQQRSSDVGVREMSWAAPHAFILRVVTRAGCRPASHAEQRRLWTKLGSNLAGA